LHRVARCRLNPQGDDVARFGAKLSR
jgi:hypothetical protein